MFKMPSRYILEQTATKFLEELYGHVEEQEIEVCEQVDKVPSTSTFDEDEIAKELAPATYSECEISKKSLQSEMTHFEMTNRRGDLLEKLFLILKNIAPTSIASEQAFSISSNFITKIRLRLSDQCIDDLVFEKGYFSKEDHY